MKIDGLDKFKRRLAAMPKEAKVEIRKALEKSADEIVAAMKALVPVDSGDLKNSIGWSWGAPPEGAKVIAKAVGDAGMSITIYAGDKVAYYARMVEFGTVKMPPRSFFRPAWRLSRKRAVSRISRATNKAAKKVAGR